MKFYKILIRWEAKDMDDATAKLDGLFERGGIRKFIEEDHDEL